MARLWSKHQQPSDDQASGCHEKQGKEDERRDEERAEETPPIAGRLLGGKGLKGEKPGECRAMDALAALRAESVCGIQGMPATPAKKGINRLRLNGRLRHLEEGFTGAGQEFVSIRAC